MASPFIRKEESKAYSINRTDNRQAAKLTMSIFDDVNKWVKVYSPYYQ